MKTWRAPAVNEGLSRKANRRRGGASSRAPAPAAVSYNRDLKIYSNIVTTQLATRSARMLTIIGARYVSPLRSMFGTDPAYRVVPAAAYLATP